MPDPIVAYDGGGFAWWACAMFKVGGNALSAPRTAADFAARNGIDSPPVTTEGPGAVQRTDCRQAGRPPVTRVTVRGGGHTVPGPVTAPFVLGKTNHDVSTADLVKELLV